MATNIENHYSPSPTNEDSDGEEQDAIDSKSFEEEPEDNVARILKQLQTSGALIKKPKQEYRCNTCDEDFSNWETLEQHLLQHVSLPLLILDKLPSDDEVDQSGDENWSDEEDAQAPEPPVPAAKTPQKIDISQLLSKTGIQIKKSGDSSDSALNKLSVLGFTIKKNTTPIKEEKIDSDKPSSNNDLMQKLGKLGGIKLKLKSDGSNTNTFKVINGLKDFKTSDDEDEGSGNEVIKDDEDCDQDASAGEQDSGDDQNDKTSHKNSESDDSNDKASVVQQKKIPQYIPIPKILPKVESEKSVSNSIPSSSPPVNKRPNFKQTPKRSTNEISGNQVRQPSQTKDINTQGNETSKTLSANITRTPSLETQENVIVKQEVVTEIETRPSDTSQPLFSGQIKTERSSPSLEGNQQTSTPLIANVKSEVDPVPNNVSQPLFNQVTNTNTTPLLPVSKTENESITIIEINGDSNDEDDDCCVVSATPAPDVKPIIPKTEEVSSYGSTSTYPPLQPSYTAPSDTSRVPSALTTEKQHCFNWNAPDSKPPIDMLEKSADDIFESLLASAKKEGGGLSSLSDTSEYISLDRLGSQHSCDICNTRFTDISLLEAHIRSTGHSKSIVTPTSSLMPYNPSSNSLLSSLLPVKQLAEQVGKLSTMGNSSGAFTHQQNVMINIQTYPGAGGMMVPPQQYTQYQPGHTMPPAYPQPNMYGGPSQTMPGQYPGQYISQQNFGQQQYQPSMSKPSYSGVMPQNLYSSSPVSSSYSSASPLQSMQQAVYGQAPSGMMNSTQGSQMSQMGQMGPPSMPSTSQYAPTSSTAGPMMSSMNAGGASGIRIQNVQTFSPGQLVGANGQVVNAGQQVTGVQSPGQIRVAGPNMTGTRPRMVGNIRGARPSIRPGVQVQGQIRGIKQGGPRMQLKRPAGPTGGPSQKRRPDMLLPGKHDNEDCQVMAMQKQREGLPLIHSVQGAKDKLNLGGQISITKKTVNKEANAMANVLASRGIRINMKQKSRSPSPERPIPHIPNLGAGVSIKHTSKSSNFSIPEAKVGSGMYSCKICRKMFNNSSSLSVHMSCAHPQSKIPVFKCDECPASYPKSLQLQHHKRTFHNVSGPNRELGLPVVDMSQSDNLKRLSNLGIYSFIPLANREQSGGCFGIPVISVNSMQNGLNNSLQALGADGLLSLGPLKSLPNS